MNLAAEMCRSTRVAGDPGIDDPLLEQPEQRAVTTVMARAKSPVPDRRTLKLRADVVGGLQAKWAMTEETRLLVHKPLQAYQGEIAQQLQLRAPPQLEAKGTQHS